MDIQSSELTPASRIILLVVAALALLGPNGLYLYTLLTRPELNDLALRNPIALAFMIEAMMLLALFLWYVRRRTGSWLQVLLYLALSFAGSLAFSFPLFLYLDSRKAPSHG